MTRIGRLLLLAAFSFWPGQALADKQLSGEDAAYIDWAVNNCGVKSTDKEHVMVDQANTKDSATFLRKYLSKNLTDAQSSPAKQSSMCTDIKAWYGPYGSRFADLIRWESGGASATSDTPQSTAPRRGRRRPSP
jgi:hypothetical protein